MSIDSNYNSQFIQIDFRLLENPAFLKFVNRAEFATYLILRRYVWRGGEHRLGLHRLYRDDHKLAASVGAARIAEMLGLKDITRVSKQLSYLVETGVVRRIRTGRETIFLLGEWYQPPGWDVSKEYYYLENCFGMGQPGDNSDLAQKAKSELQLKPSLTWLKKPSSNREGNREKNTVTNGVISSDVIRLPDLGHPSDQLDYLVDEIIAQLGDRHSEAFYRLVAAHVPETVIYKTLSEIKADGARQPARLFTYRMNQYAIDQRKKGIGRIPTT